MGIGTMVETRSVTVGGKPVEVKTMVFFQRTRILKALATAVAEIKKSHPDFDLQAKATAAGQSWDMLPAVADLLGDHMADIYAAVTGVDAAEIRANMTVPEEAALWKAFAEVNDLPLLVGSLKEMFGSLKSSGGS